MFDKDFQAELKRRAAYKAMDFIESGMRIGLGTGSTVDFLLEALGLHIEKGLKISAVATSEKTLLMGQERGIPFEDLNRYVDLDLTIDGADECDPSLRLIKGGGGALLREKIVANASKKFIIIADESKYVEQLGCFPLPIEVSSFGYRSIERHIIDAARSVSCFGEITLRQKNGKIFITDGGNVILDYSCGLIKDPEGLASLLSSIPGVFGHGLFLSMASCVILARKDGLDILKSHF